MAAVSQATNTLLGGISQQPDPNKLPGQVRDAVNVQLNPTFGCEKRPPAKFSKVLANDITISPDASFNQTIKWFNIFRDTQEKYIVCIYRDDTSNPASTRLRVWDCETGDERCVYIYAESQVYLDSTSPTDYRHLTIGDFTLITNPNKLVTMNGVDNGGGGGGEVPQPVGFDEALVVVNQIAYNTTYNINFLKSSGSTPVKVYSAATLSVTPATFEENDGGGCTKATSQSFIEDQGDKTGLSFDLTAICQPTQVAEETANNSYPTAADLFDGIGDEALAIDRLGLPSQYGNGSYVYVNGTANGVGFAATCSLRIEYRVTGVTIDNDGDVDEGSGDYVYSNVSIVGYDEDHNWAVDDQVSIEGVLFKITSIKTPDDTISYDYKSVYRTSVRLRSGGIGWREGDTVTVTMSGKSYNIKVETETFGYGFASEAGVSFTTQASIDSGGNLDVGDIVGGLVTQINEIGNYSAEAIGNVIYIQRTDGQTFNIQVNGGTADRALYAIKGSVNDVSLLPIQCKDGVTLLVRNTVDSTADDYYVKFTTAEASIPGQGSWEETVKPGIPTTLDPSSLPQGLIRRADGNFTLKPLSPSLDCSPNKTGSWVAREVGDLESNPDPSFVGKGITNMFFFQNRLGLLSEDAVIMSQPGAYFNFFVGSAIAVSDADPIDMIAASEEPSFLKDAVSVPQGTLLFAENSQYLLATQEVAFGPSTAKITKISEYSYDSKIKPLETGVSIMFHTEAATFSKIFEMAIPNTDQARPQVADLTRVIPEYIPPTINWSASNPNNNQVFFGSGNDTAYNFSFFNVAEKRSMSGWTKWVFNYDVAHMAFFQDRGFVVLYNPHTLSFILTTVDPLDNPGDSTITAAGREFTPRLDALIPKSSCTLRDISDTETEVTIPCFLAVKGEDNTTKEITAIFGDLGNATYFQKYPLLAGETCEDPPPTPGPCVPDDCAAPNPDACAGVTCPPGEVCSGGFCFPDNPGPGPGPGPVDPCEGVQCPPGEICVDGICEPGPDPEPQPGPGGGTIVSPASICKKLSSGNFTIEQLYDGEFIGGAIPDISEITSLTFQGYTDFCAYESWKFLYKGPNGDDRDSSIRYGGSEGCQNITWEQIPDDPDATCDDISSLRTATNSNDLKTLNTFIISKEDAALDFSVGFSYPMKVELPSFYVTSDQDADRNNVPIIENVKTYLYLSGSYQAKLTRLGYEDRLIDLEVAKADIYLADSNPISEVGIAEIPLFCQGDLAIIEITSTSPLPAALTGYGWEGHYNNRGIKSLKRQ